MGVGGTDSDQHVGGPLVIAIAPSSEHRARLAQIVDASAALVLVSSAAEARTFLESRHVAGPQRDLDRDTTAPLSVGGLDIDSDRHIAVCAGREVALTPLEHDLLCCLAEDAGRTWSFDRLHEAVWGTRYVGAGANLHSVVKRLRRKLRQLGTSVGIDTVRGVGFRLSTADSGARVRGLSAVD
jgi:DNA-binding response OmpR family regulator